MGERDKQGIKWFAGILITTALSIILATGGSYISTMNRMTKIETNFDNQCIEVERLRNTHSIIMTRVESKVEKGDYREDMQELKQDIKDIKQYLMEGNR